jgi:hypothetical protein
VAAVQHVEHAVGEDDRCREGGEGARGSARATILARKAGSLTAAPGEAGVGAAAGHQRGLHFLADSG